MQHLLTFIFILVYHIIFFHRFPTLSSPSLIKRKKNPKQKNPTTVSGTSMPHDLELSNLVVQKHDQCPHETIA